jgi:hypothetical protein
VRNTQGRQDVLGRDEGIRAARSLVGAWGEDSRNSFPKHLRGESVLEGVPQRTAPDKFLSRLRLGGRASKSSKIVAPMPASQAIGAAAELRCVADNKSRQRK